jgi:hypothetical protein
MIRVVMFDLGMTLVDANHRPFDHVEEALSAVAVFKAADGEPLRSCLVSDYTMVTPPVTAGKIAAIFNEYLTILDETGLRSFFEPVDQRVTLSTHAGAEKPNRKIFEKALQRLGASISLDECLFITENAAHISEARNTLAMKTMQFRSADSSSYDFDSWAEAPALIANLVAPQEQENLHAAIKAYLAAKSIDLLASESIGAADTLKFSGLAWCPISVPGFQDLLNVQVAIPVEGKIAREQNGKLRSVTPAKPSAEQTAEAISYVHSLATHGRIASNPTQPSTGATHQIETDEKGNRRLVRKRFSTL